jgi:hypothetical protein
MHLWVDDQDSMLQKAYASAAVILAGRGCEVGALVVGDVTRVVDAEGNATFLFTFDRSKGTTCKGDRQTAILSCRLGVAAIDRYIALRPVSRDKNKNIIPLTAVQKAKKFFRRIAKPTPKGTMKIGWEAQNVGKGTLGGIARAIAKRLGLENWEKFTGHAFRRTACTFGANAGMTLPQLKAMTGKIMLLCITVHTIANTNRLPLTPALPSILGHQSDSAAQIYIDNGLPMKMLASSATAIEPPSASSIPATSSILGTKRPAASQRQGGGDENRRAPNYVINITVTGDVSAPLSVFGGAKGEL